MSYQPLPTPTINYSASLFATAFARITNALLNTYSKTDDIEILRQFDTSGTEVSEQRLILQAPNQHKFKITVDNSGNLSATQIT